MNESIKGGKQLQHNKHNSSKQPEFRPEPPRPVDPEAPLEELVNRGREASEFLRGLEEGSKYFLTVLNKLQEDLIGEILTLKPFETERFTVLKAYLDMLYRPFGKVQEDVAAGEEASRILRSPGGAEGQTKGGLL